MLSGAPAIRLASRTPQRGQGVQCARQALFPRAFAFEAGFDVADGKRARGASQQLCHSAHLLWQPTRPRWYKADRFACRNFAI